MKDYSNTIIEYGRKVKDKKYTWEEATIEFNKVSGLNLTTEAFRSRYRNTHDQYEPSKEEKFNQSFETHNEDGTIDITKDIWFSPDEEKTPDTILNKFGYSTTEFELVSWSFGQWEVLVKGSDDTRLCTTIRAKVKPKVNLSSRDIVNTIQEVLDEEIQPIVLPKKISNEELDNDKMLVFSLADMHLGKYCNELDSGFNYDLDIASQWFKEIITGLIELQEQKRTGQLLYTIGNDFFNCDNTHGTTSKGTILENATTYRAMYKRGLELQIQALKSIREYFNQIKVVLVQGNHDEILDYTLYLALQQIFKDDDVIEFKSDYKLTQAEKFGNTSIYLDHGAGNYNRFINSLSTLFPKIYGDTTYRYALLHHLHSEHSIEERNGITAFRLPSVVPRDGYEYKEKFITSDSKQAVYEISKDYGLESISYIRIKR